MPQPSSSSMISYSQMMPHAFNTDAFEMRLKVPSTSPANVIFGSPLREGLFLNWFLSTAKIHHVIASFSVRNLELGR
ncbi:hypothetical protein DEO72_LG11g1712 [Vigna unguiculata]|uniref:Uncharacterized protein n=1 Tax=Vigna unguiculata TaxID=3917 RepID=A0A4D6NMY5_VIGUN|nr:hypothetical protein DEO72_LG11g1712 [Vigna unguiculata]